MRRRYRIVLACAALGGFAACAHILGFHDEGRKPFEHRPHVLQGIACADCHTNMLDAGETGPLHLPDAESCVRCHEKPHDPRPCMGCHGLPDTEARTAASRQHLVFSHQAHLPTMRGDCVRCHIDVRGEDETLLPPMVMCLGCHDHREEWDTRTCEACHVDLPAETVRPVTHVLHGASFLRQHGAFASSAADLCASCHNQRFCASCHGTDVPALPHRLFFDRPTFASLHRANFRARHSLEASTQPGLCMTCHSRRSCDDCHGEESLSASGGPGVASAEGPLRNPHPPGWVSLGRAGQNDHGPAARRDPFSCSACHGGAGEQLCVTCHKSGGVGGSIHPPGWSSNKNKTGDLPCRLCHGPL